MKIGIESQRIFRRARHGMDLVALELIREIQQLDHDNQYILFARNGDDSDCLSDSKNFRTEILKGFSYADWEQISLPRAVERIKPDILHCTANTAPLNVRVPMIVTVHDVIYLEGTTFKGSAYQNFGNVYRKYVVPHAIRNAKKIVTVSEHERQVISDVCKVNVEKIEVIYNGVSERFHMNIAEEKLLQFRTRYNLPEKFILFLGNTAPKKNTIGAIRAYVEYCLNEHAPLHLVVADFPKSSIRSILERLGHPGLMKNIIAPGYIPSDEMPLLYNCSSLFLYPSLRESFGLPVLEAMACGKPVIASSIPALREVAGDAATFVEPNNATKIAETISGLLSDQSKQTAQIEKGLQRTSLFSWKRSAIKLIELYKNTI